MRFPKTTILLAEENCKTSTSCLKMQTDKFSDWTQVESPTFYQWHGPYENCQCIGDSPEYLKTHVTKHKSNLWVACWCFLMWNGLTVALWKKKTNRGSHLQSSTTGYFLPSGGSTEQIWCTMIKRKACYMRKLSHFLDLIYKDYCLPVPNGAINSLDNNDSDTHASN